MNWEAIGALWEVGGAIAVVVTLIYLAKQIRQNTAQVRVQTDALVAQTTSDFVGLLAHEGMARVYRRGLDGETLDEDDDIRFSGLLYLNFNNIENYYRQYQQAQMDEGQWQKWHDLLGWYLRQPGARRWWQETELPLGRDFKELVDRQKGRDPPGRAQTEGIRPLKLHSTRHTWATLALASGKSIRWVANQLGHADPAMTLRVYAHALREEEADMSFVDFNDPKRPYTAPPDDEGLTESRNYPCP